LIHDDGRTNRLDEPESSPVDCADSTLGDSTFDLPDDWYRSMSGWMRQQLAQGHRGDSMMGR